MKKRIYQLFFLLTGLLFTCQVALAQQTKTKPPAPGIYDRLDTRVDNMGYWMKMAAKGLTPYNPDVPIPPAIYRGTRIAGKGIVTDSPDVPVTTITATTQSENSVFVDPDDNMHVLNSNNSTDFSGGSVSSVYGANYFLSPDAGTTWGGTVNGAGGPNSGDPTTAINRDGREFVNYISDPGGQGIAFSDNEGSTWSTATIAANPGDLADKNHMWIDNSLTSSYQGNLYVAWTDFGGTDDTEIKISRSTDDGATWSTGVNLSSAINAGSHNQGVNIQTGPGGEVYVCWTVYDSWPSDETAIGFAKSTNGGASYTTASRIISNIKGIRTTETSKNHRVNSFPSMAVDISGGPNNGNIYIVWANIGVPGTNTGTNISVYMIRSSNGGTTWSTPVRVNQGTYTEGKESYFPWITCDPATGALGVIFYDDRNTTSTQAETWVAVSTDAGNNWSDFRVSDVAFTPTPISGLASSYMGDYLGITARGGRFYPCWTDTRNSEFKTYVSPFELGLNAGFTASATTICSGSAVTFTDLSSGPPTSWTWSFPGGTPSSYVGQNPPAITYDTPGTYDVTLEVSDGSGTDTEVKTGYITVKNVIADFSGTPTTVVIGNTVTFTDNSSCSPATWEWSFPGGDPSSYSGQAPPAITYNTVGTYDVSLTVTKPGSTDTQVKAGYITVTPPIFNMTNGTVTTCTGDFYDSGGSSGSYANNESLTETFYPSTAGAMVRMTFTSFSTESGYDYLRIYNGTSTAATLIGTYTGSTGPGTVTASNPSGALTFNFTSDYSVVSTGWAASISCYSATVPPVADFSASATSVSLAQTVTFTDLSTELPTSWAWSFTPNTVTYMDGTSATSQNPHVQFTAAGQYTVTLTATNAYGSDSETKTNYITASQIYLMSNSTVTTCSGEFYDSGGASGSYQNSESYVMTFNPQTAGSMVRATFSSFATESGYDYLYIYDGTSTSATLLGTYNGSTGPGTVTATNAAGALTFRFTSDGSVTYAGWAATISCYNPAAPPVADFSATPLNVLTNQTVTFTDLTTNAPTSWAWSFSPNTMSYVDGTSATSQNPHVQFAALGQYTVTLTATNAYGSDGETKTNYITVSNTCVVSTLPWSEGFAGTTIPSCWTQVDHQGNGQIWHFGTVTGESILPALTGNYAYLNSDGYGTGNSQNADLISPTLDLTSYTNITLGFKHYFRYYSPSSGTVSYSINDGMTWTTLATYTSTTANPATFSQVITAAAGQSQVKFRWNYTGTYGWYWAVDDISVTGTCANSPSVSVSIAASANPVDEGTEVTFTATPVNGGATPAYQWKVNGSNAGTNSSTYAYIPADGDVVTCVVTSSLTCVTGNPATSNTVTMTVNSVPVNLDVTNVTVTNSQCFDATSTITVAGNGTTFAVEYGGIARFYAGERIVYNPGTWVKEGGYMLGTIVPGGPYCPQDTKIATQVASAGPVKQADQPFFKVYPNPTTGTFTLALDGYVPADRIRVMVYDMQGSVIRTAEMVNEMKHEFSISGSPAGLYLIKVTTGYQSGSSRIVMVK